MPNKTKAALQGRQCQRIKLKPGQIITLIDQVKLTAPLAQFDLVSEGIPPTALETAVVPVVTFYSIRGKAPVTGNPVSVIEGIPPVGVKGYPALSHTPIGQPFGSSLAFLRCSLLSLRPQASSTHDEKLAPGFSGFSRSTLASISSINSCGKRIPFVVERLFLKPVAMLFPLYWCRNTIQVRKEKKSIDVYMHLDIWCLCTLILSMVQIAKPGSVGALTGLLTKPLYEVTIMADIKSTQTRPKFTFLFLAIYPNGGRPTVLRTDADTEQEARLKIEGTDFTLIFAAQIRTESPLHFHRIDLDSGRIEFMHQRYQTSTEVLYV